MERQGKLATEPFQGTTLLFSRRLGQLLRAMSTLVNNPVPAHSGRLRPHEHITAAGLASMALLASARVRLPFHDDKGVSKIASSPGRREVGR